MSKYVVHLLQPLDVPARAVAVHAAPHLSVEADRLEQVLARGPGVVTQPTSRTEAQRVADILAAAGAPAQVRPAAPNLDAFPAPPGVVSRAGSSAGTTGVSTPKRRGPARRLSLRGKLLLLTLLPVLLLAGATLYLGFGAVRELSRTLSASWADALALTLASDVSAAIAQNGLAVGSTLDEEVSRYVTERLRLNEAGLRGVVGVAVTDAAGRPLVLSWSPERPAPPPAVLQEVATATLIASDFGENAAAFSATLNARTRRFSRGFAAGSDGSFSSRSNRSLNNMVLVGAPLLSDVGTVQVALDADAPFLSARFTRPLLLVVLTVLVLATLLVLLFASRFIERLRVLTTAANHLSLGELDEPVALRGNDEMRDLAEALEHMRVALRAAVSQMRRREGRGR